MNNYPYWFGPPMPQYQNPPRKRGWRGSHRRANVDDLAEALAYRDSIDEFIKKELDKRKDTPAILAQKRFYHFSAMEWVLLLFILSPLITKVQKVIFATAF